MKKKLLAIISLLVALVMSFALIACNGDNTPDPTPGPNGGASELTVGKVVTALNRVTDHESGFKATAEYSASTKNSASAEDNSGSISLEKRGTQVGMIIKNDEGDDDEGVLDLRTGYFYEKTKDGTYKVGMGLPAGMFDYVMNALSGEVGSNIDETVKISTGDGYAFDGKTNTLTVTLDKKDSINNLIAPLSEAYKNNSSVKALINEYLGMVFDDGTTLDDLFATGSAFIVAAKDVTVDAFVTSMGTTVEDVLTLVNFEVSTEVVAAIKARKVGDLLAGAFGYLDNNMEAIMNGDVVTEELVEDLLFAMLVEEVDNSTLEDSIDRYLGIISPMLDSLKVADLVDDSLSETMLENAIVATLYTAIKEGVTLDALKAEFTLVFDDNYNISKLTFEGDIAHSYTETDEKAILLNDNDYHAEFELNITEYFTD